MSKIYVDDNRCIMERIKKGYRFDRERETFVYSEGWLEEDNNRIDDERIAEEILKAMNHVNPDLQFTIEKESDFPNKRLPTLGFEMWSEKEKIRHSYFEKEMRSQVLTEKRSSQAENQKFAILTNELTRRLQMMDDEIGENERVCKINHFTQQLINSGYQWEQIREIIISSLKGFLKKEVRRKEKEESRYKKAEETLEERIKRKLTENVTWYKESSKNREKDDKESKEEVDKETGRWKPWRKAKRNKLKRSKRESRGGK